MTRPNQKSARPPDLGFVAIMAGELLRAMMMNPNVDPLSGAQVAKRAVEHALELQHTLDLLAAEGSSDEHREPEDCDECRPA